MIYAEIMAGSSPHGRGTLHRGLAHLRRQRFIPARAGNTPSPALIDHLPAVHPRTGGEHYHRVADLAAWNGSSPHGRGTLAGESKENVFERFIPARAGNTFSGAWPKCAGTVHPRTGGEHQRGIAWEMDRIRFIPARGGEHMQATGRSGRKCGSSPHGRGTRAS